MRRREFITLVGGAAAALPLGACEPESKRAMPVIGFVSSSNESANTAANLLDAFRNGLKEGGYVEGRNLAIEYRWAAGQANRLPALLEDLIGHKVALIVASGGFASAMAAKTATKVIPILFVAGFDPVAVGLVESISHPNGNATGVSVYTIELLQKRLEFLLKVVPGIKSIALLVHPNPYGSDLEIMQMEQAARESGLKLLVLKADTEGDLEPMFASAADQRSDALVVSADPFFTPRRARIIVLASRFKLPAIYPWREYVAGGGLMSFGPTLAWAYERIGYNATRILNGTKLSELPVELPRQFELVINLTTAKSLGLTIPRTVIASAELVD